MQANVDLEQQTKYRLTLELSENEAATLKAALNTITGPADGPRRVTSIIWHSLDDAGVEQASIRTNLDKSYVAGRGGRLYSTNFLEYMPGSEHATG